MSVIVAVIIVIILIAIVLAIYWFSLAPSGECISSVGCKGGQICVKNVCVACTSNDQCGDGVCVSGSCVPKGCAAFYQNVTFASQIDGSLLLSWKLDNNATAYTIYFGKTRDAVTNSDYTQTLGATISTFRFTTDAGVTFTPATIYYATVVPRYGSIDCTSTAPIFAAKTFYPYIIQNGSIARGEGIVSNNGKNVLTLDADGILRFYVSGSDIWNSVCGGAYYLFLSNSGGLGTYPTNIDPTTTIWTNGCYGDIGSYWLGVRGDYPGFEIYKGPPNGGTLIWNFDMRPPVAACCYVGDKDCTLSHCVSHPANLSQCGISSNLSQCGNIQNNYVQNTGAENSVEDDPWEILARRFL